MADQDKTPTDATEVSADVTETELENVVGGSAFLKIDGVEGESTDDKHKDRIHISS
jgi:hypothetical protein